MTEVLPIDLSKDRRGAFPIAVQHAKQGEQIVYHQGAFCAGPHREGAMIAKEKGYVVLVQKRVGTANFKYIAIRTKKEIT